MSSNAISGIGTTLSRWNAAAESSTGAWETVAEINSISGPGMSRETIDVTSLDTTGGYREFIGSLRDPGDLSLNMNFTRDGFDQMKEDFESDNRQNFQISIPDTNNTTLEFEALVSELPLEIPADDKISMDVTLKISGKVNVASGSQSV